MTTPRPVTVLAPPTWLSRFGTPAAMPKPQEAPTRAYELGRARGACYSRGEPTDRDWEWLDEQLGGPEVVTVPACEEFELGMLDGAEQAHCARIGLQGTPPPPAEAIAAAKDR